jgi:hypothetical protein
VSEMNKFSLLILSILASCAVKAKELPNLDFPILSSELIGSHCTDETNLVRLILELNDNGKVKEYQFLKKSTLPAINDEALNNVLKASPYSEILELDRDEKQNYFKIIMNYRIPCASHNKALEESDAKNARFN